MLTNLFDGASLFSYSDQRRTFEKRELQPITLPYNGYSERLAAELLAKGGPTEVSHSRGLRGNAMTILKKCLNIL